MATPTINLNNLLPPPEANNTNVKWQSVVSVHTNGITNVSAELPNLTPSGTGHQAGLAPDPGGTAGSTRYLREDATWDVPSSVASSLLFALDGDSLSGWTLASSNVTADVATSGFAPGDFQAVVQSGPATAQGNYGYIDTGIAGFGGCVIEFDIAANYNGSYGSGNMRVVFGADALGNGPCFYLDGSGSGPSGLTSVSTWNGTIGAVTSGLTLTTKTWYHVKIVINAAGTQATVIINGQVISQIAITLGGVYLGFANETAPYVAGYLANLRVYVA